MLPVSNRTARRFRKGAKSMRGVASDNPVLKVPTEHQEQVLFVQWFRREYPSVRIFAIPNGEARSQSAGARLKAEGVSAGVPDLFIPAWNTWIEMKRSDGGRISPKQKDWWDYLSGIDHQVFVCAGADSAKEVAQRVYKLTL
tara:strand:+ start:156 stop:581 length:426 start_codon:yes stop_codon:yes gene_type:complete